MTQIQAYLCDLDGTLYRPSIMKWLIAAELMLFAPQHISTLRRFRRVHESLREELVASPELEFSPTPLDEQLYRAATNRLDEAALRKVVTTWMMKRPGKWLRRLVRRELIEGLQEFRTAGGKLGVVSDYPAKDKLESMGLDTLFDVVVANGEHPELRRLKPAPDGYLIAAQALGVPPAQCLVIGDRDDADGAAARRAGMQFRLIGATSSAPSKPRREIKKAT